MPDFPKPPPKQTLTLNSKAAQNAKLDDREVKLEKRAAEVAEQEKLVLAQQEELEAKRVEIETRLRAVLEAELLLKNQKLLHQKQLGQLMEQKELIELRKQLEDKRDDLEKKEQFVAQTEKRLHIQLAEREEAVAKREAWISAEHEQAMLRENRRLQAIVFTDVVSYSARMQANEAQTIQKVRTDLQRMQDDGKSQGGMLINTMGDGMLMIFPSAIQAVRFSLAMQKKFNERVAADGLQHRFGIHIADVALLPDGGIAGDGVNIASRLESKAPNGGICLSSIVYLLVKGKLQLPPSTIEEVALKNIKEPMPVYKYQPEAIAAITDAGGSVPQLPITEEERSTPPFE